MLTRNRQRIALLITASLGAIALAAASASAAEGSTSLATHAQTDTQAQAQARAQAVNGRTVIASGMAVASHATGTGAQPAAGGTIFCEVVADPPEAVPAGSPFGGQVKPFNAVGAAVFTTCTGAVSRISMTPALSFNSGAPIFGPTATTLGTFSASGAVLSFCAPGDWQAGASSTVIMPAGFTPPTLQLAATSGQFNFTEFDCNPGIL